MPPIVIQIPPFTSEVHILPDALRCEVIGNYVLNVFNEVLTVHFAQN